MKWQGTSTSDRPHFTGRNLPQAQHVVLVGLE